VGKAMRVSNATTAATSSKSPAWCRTFPSIRTCNSTCCFPTKPPRGEGYEGEWGLAVPVYLRAAPPGADPGRRQPAWPVPS
jgi:hypothetical protein